jgi:hypothetical protein
MKAGTQPTVKGNGEQKCITIIKINFTNFVYEGTVLVETQCRLQFQGVEV